MLGDQQVLDSQFGVELQRLEDQAERRFRFAPFAVDSGNGGEPHSLAEPVSQLPVDPDGLARPAECLLFVPYSAADLGYVTHVSGLASEVTEFAVNAERQEVGLE